MSVQQDRYPCTQYPGTLIISDMLVRTVVHRAHSLATLTVWPSVDLWITAPWRSQMENQYVVIDS